MKKSIESQLILAAKFIEKNSEKEINLNSIAKSSFISSFYFHKLFKSYFGVTPIDYLEQTRIKNSIYLMKFTKLSLADISFSVGFKNHETFSRSFKKTISKTPLEFRKNSKQKIQTLNQSIQKSFDIKVEKKIIPKTNYVFIRTKNSDYNFSKTWRNLIDLSVRENLFKENVNCIGIWNWNINGKVKSYDLGIITNKNSKFLNHTSTIESKFLIFTYVGTLEKLAEVYDYIFNQYVIKENLYLKPNPPIEIYEKFPPFFYGKNCLTKILLPIQE